MNRFTLILAILPPLAVSTASAQSINIDFGSPGSAPSPSYAGAGRAGVWNSLGAINSTPRPLVGLDGQPTAVTIHAVGGAGLFLHDNPATSGDHAALMDDMFISTNSPVDLCLYIYNLQPGDYDVIIYAMDPDNPEGRNRTRVDFAVPGPTWVGGAWPGHHVQGTTYSRFQLHVTDGRILPHSGELSANYRSGINGIQLIFADPCYANCDASTTPPILNIDDFTCFINNYAAASSLPHAQQVAHYTNCDSSTTAPALNIDDFTCFINAFAAGCP